MENILFDVVFTVFLLELHHRRRSRLRRCRSRRWEIAYNGDGIACEHKMDLILEYMTRIRLRQMNRKHVVAVSVRSFSLLLFDGVRHIHTHSSSGRRINIFRFYYARCTHRWLLLLLAQIKLKIVREEPITGGVRDRKVANF